MTQTQFSLIKKIKIGRPEHSLTFLPPSLRPITFHFCITPQPPQSGRHMCITPKQKSFIFLLAEFDAG